MPKYSDIGSAETFKNDLADEMKPNGVDLLLPFEDFNTGWMLLARGSSVTLNHGFGAIPRLTTVYINTVAIDDGARIDRGADVATAVKIDTLTANTAKVTNSTSLSSNKYIKVLLWR